MPGGGGGIGACPAYRRACGWDVQLHPGDTQGCMACPGAWGCGLCGAGLQGGLCGAGLQGRVTASAGPGCRVGLQPLGVGLQGRATGSGYSREQRTRAA